MSSGWVGEPMCCPRGPDECPGLCEPEEDGELRYWKCQECGQEFGYRTAPARADVCAAGVPLEHLTADPHFQRRLREANADSRFTQGLESADGEFTGVFLGNIGRRPGDA